jgi:periplasmic protein CpxP/Spy
MTAVDDLKTYQEFTQAHLDGIKNLISAFETLYNSMPDQQKKNADEVFAKFNRAAPRPGAAAPHNG